jgi:hypothetical protein
VLYCVNIIGVYTTSYPAFLENNKFSLISYTVLRQDVGWRFFI